MGDYKEKYMKDYIYFNDKEFRFFRAENAPLARHLIINNFDLRFNPAFLRIYNLETFNDNDKKKYRFYTRASLTALRLKKFFNLNGSGEGGFSFFK